MTQLTCNRRDFLKTAAVTTSTAMLSAGTSCALLDDESSTVPLVSNAKKKTNILLILADDMGYSDIGCYGGEVHTPNLDSLAAGGLRFTQFYNTARCCPSRASLLTGLHPHQASIGHTMGDDGIDGYRGDLSPNAVTIAEVLKLGGYSTYICGKWHVTRHSEGPKHNWPAQRGFDEYYGLLVGGNYFNPLNLVKNNEFIAPEGDDYYLTDAITDNATRQIREHALAHKDTPFLQYVAYTAPHWPLHAPEEDIAKYRGRFDAGWDVLRRERIERMVDMGLIHKNWLLSERDTRVGPWEDEENKKWQVRRMEVYAAQVDRMDQGVGRIMQALRDTGDWENTLIVFLSDNGGCAENIGPKTANMILGKKLSASKTRDGRDVRIGNQPHILPGGDDTFASYGIAWANVSNTPFRLYKHWVHEGGIATPFIVHWPAGIKYHNELRHQPAQLPDVMATFLDVAGAGYPETHDGKAIIPLEGFSMVPSFSDLPHEREVLYWEHEGNRAVRKGKWKLVSMFPRRSEGVPMISRSWELYDMEMGRTEVDDLSTAHPEIVQELTDLYNKWAERCHVKPWEELLELRAKKPGQGDSEI